MFKVEKLFIVYQGILARSGKALPKYSDTRIEDIPEEDKEHWYKQGHRSQIAPEISKQLLHAHINLLLICGNPQSELRWLLQDLPVSYGVKLYDSRS